MIYTLALHTLIDAKSVVVKEEIIKPTYDKLKLLASLSKSQLLPIFILSERETVAIYEDCSFHLHFLWHVTEKLNPNL